MTTFCLQIAAFVTNIWKWLGGALSMGFRFSRSVRILPGIKLNLSGSGVSVSLGARGFHYNIGRKGTRVTAGVPGTGMSWSHYSPYPRKPNELALQPRELEPPQYSENAGLSAVHSAPTEQINALSTSQLAPILNGAERKFRLAKVILFASVLLFIVAFVQKNEAWLSVVAVYAATLIPIAVLLDRHRRSVKISFENEGVVARIVEAMAAGFEALASSKAAWTVQAEGQISDWKRNAGASGQVARRKIRLLFDKPSCIRGRIRFPSFKSGSQELYLLPDSALLVARGAVAAVSYNDLELSNSVVKFIENERVHSDTAVVGKTWRFVNKAGGPDRRFLNNSELPVCLYAELGFRTDGGLNCKFQLSNAQAANSLCKVIEVLQRSPELPKSIAYAKSAKSWPTFAFLLVASAAGFAQIGFFDRETLVANVRSKLATSNASQTMSLTPPTATNETPAKKEVRKSMPPTRSLEAPLELKPPTISTADVVSPSAVMAPQSPADLNDIANVRWVQARLRELGFLRAASANASWDASSRSALRDFKATNNIGNDDAWDFKTEQALKSGAALRAEQTFIGSWSEATCDARSKPDITISSRRATSSAGGVCEFTGLAYVGSSWNVATTCSNAGERWSANIRLAVVDGKLIWTGRDGTGTQYFRCR